MTSSLQMEYDNACSGAWADLNPNKCGCRGKGWFLSDVDTWHPCRFHCDPEAGHPEDDRGPYTADEVSGIIARRMQMMRGIYRRFQEASGLDKKAFRAACAAEYALRFEGADEVQVEERWLDVADDVCTERVNERREAEARAEGYSCDLERRWEADALLEQEERAHGGW